MSTNEYCLLLRKCFPELFSCWQRGGANPLFFFFSATTKNFQIKHRVHGQHGGVKGRTLPETSLSPSVWLLLTPQVTTWNSNQELLSVRRGGALPVSLITCSELRSVYMHCWFLNTEKDSHRNKPDFHQIVGFVAGMQKEPDFLHKVVNAWLSPRASDVHHPLMGRLIVLFSLIWGDVPNSKKIAQNREISNCLVVEYNPWKNWNV